MDSQIRYSEQNHLDRKKPKVGVVHGELTYYSGTIIDPIHQVIDSQDSVVDPEKYLREFNYGIVSTLPNGSMLREFTLVASDQLVKEVSHGVSYNV
ncbi:MAG: hypothetical protein ACRD8W_15775 [Nitrososphaeraceae archaeon]